jgi:uncharacterized protein
LATGRKHLGKLMDCFAGLNVKHSIYTNATLINDGWCEFFSDRGIHVGVSVDGWEFDNTSRVDRRGSSTYERIVLGYPPCHPTPGCGTWSDWPRSAAASNTTTAS